MNAPAPTSFLLIEDSYADVLLLERELKRQGLRVTLHCVDTLAALQDALHRQRWDLVLADYHVPGLPFARALQEVQARQPDCPVIILSGEVGEEVAVEQLKLGAADFVLKDRPARLGQVILRALDDAAARRAHGEASLRLRENAEALRLSSVVFGSVREGILICDPGGRVVAVNPAFLQLAGVEEASLLGSRVHELGPAGQGDDFYGAVWTAMLHHDHWQGEVFRRTPGQTLPLWLSASTVRSPDGEVLNHVALLTDISRLKRSEAMLEHLAQHDQLTGLPNRLQLMSRLRHALNRARRNRTHGALLFIDLDEFKRVNDSKGHPVGDKLLQQVAARLRACLRESDTLARLGGDEFVVVLEDLPDTQHAATVAQNLIDEVHRSFRVESHEFVIGASVGISIFPAEGKDPDEVIQHADTALYHAKANGRGRYWYYTRALTDAVNRRQAMDSAVRRALSCGEFELHYQPIVDMQTGCAVTAEALVRWRDPDQGLVPPDQFIPFAEESGLIVPLGRLILRLACEQLAAWGQQGVRIHGLSVNLSRRQFRQEDIVSDILQVIAETGVSPELLILEITESALMDHREAAIQKLELLRNVGIRVAIDDFGVGYSCMDALPRFPVTTLKIDKGFVEQIPHDRMSSAIVAMVIGMGNTMDLQVVAEGVENADQLAYLRSKGCHEVQGYLLSRPVTADELPGALRLAELRFRGQPVAASQT